MPGCTSRIPTGLTCKFLSGEASDDVGAILVVALLPATQGVTPSTIRSRPRGAQTGATTRVAPTAGNVRGRRLCATDDAVL
jgi:hypothetical protein